MGEEKEVKTPLSVRTSQIGAINRCVPVMSSCLNILWFVSHVKKYTTFPSILTDLIESLRQVIYW